MNVDVSPDGREIVFDLLGDIYVLPITGGRARLLVGGRTWEGLPRYSPDGARIAFASDRDGADTVWTMDRHGRNIQRLIAAPAGKFTRKPVEFLALAWSGNSTQIIASTNNGPALIDVQPSTLKWLKGLPFEGYFQPLTISPDGEVAYGSFLKKILRLEIATEKLTYLESFDSKDDPFPLNQNQNPTASHSGRLIAYASFRRDGTAALRVRNLAGSADRELITLSDADYHGRGKRPLFAFTPDDRAIVIGMSGRIWRVPLDVNAPSLISFKAQVRKEAAERLRPPVDDLTSDSIQIKGIRAPAPSPDGAHIVFGALKKLWVYDRANLSVRRLTTSHDQEESTATISADGKWVAYLAYDPMEQFHNGRPATRAFLMVTQLANAPSTPRRLPLTANNYSPPVWFSDNQRVLTLATEEGGLEGTAIGTALWVHLRDNTVHTGGKIPAWDGAYNRMRAVIGPDDRYYWARGFSLMLQTPPESDYSEIKSIKLDGTDEHTHLQLDWSVQVSAITAGARHVAFAPMTEPGILIAAIPDLKSPKVRLGPSDRSQMQRIENASATSVMSRNSNEVLYAAGPAMGTIGIPPSARNEKFSLDWKTPRARPEGFLAIRNVRLVTMSGSPGHEQVIDDGVLIMKGDRLTAVGKTGRVKIPAEAMVVEGKGLTIVPGFVDMHNHPSSTNRPIWDDIGNLAYGITAIYDPHQWYDAEQEHQETIVAGHSIGPRHYFSGLGWGVSYPYFEPSKMTQYVALSRRNGAGLMKSFCGEGSVSRAQQQALLATVREFGLGMTQHVDTFRCVLNFVLDGGTAIEHAERFGFLYGDMFALLAQTGVNWTPTLVIQQTPVTNSLPEGLVYYLQQFNRERPGELVKFSRFSWPGQLDLNTDPEDFPKLPYEKLKLAQTAKVVAKAMRAGVTVSVSAHNPPGLLSHLEMWAIADGGTTPMQALRAFTVNGAEKINLDRHIGTLAPGKMADFVVLSSNPLQNIRNSTHIKYVVKNGELYDGETMTRLWPAYRRLPRMAWQTSDDYARLSHAKPLGAH